MRITLGYILIIIAMLVGASVGIYFTVDGYYDIATSMQQERINSTFSNGAFILGVVKLIFAGTIGFISALIMLIPAWLLLRHEGGEDK